uniref:Uncharacterized protein n=1 Tax=Onchocerca volvulus TaxID=6282 RepID=A0A8R1XTH1_ONCVO
MQDVPKFRFKPQQSKLWAETFNYLKLGFCCPAHAGRSKISLQATAVETLGRNIQLPQTWDVPKFRFKPQQSKLWAETFNYLKLGFCCPAHAGRSKISLQATAVETLGRNIQLPQTWDVPKFRFKPQQSKLWAETFNYLKLG